MGLFVDGRGVRLVLGALAAVVLLALLDLRCSSGGGEEAAAGGALARVKGEMGAGKRALAENRREQIAEQLRDFRALNKRLAAKGDKEGVRRVTALILELEGQYEALDGRARK